jgi:hypothetical protein
MQIVALDQDAQRPFMMVLKILGRDHRHRQNLGGAGLGTTIIDLVSWWCGNFHSNDFCMNDFN